MGVGVGWEGGWGGDRHVVQKEDESIGEGERTMRAGLAASPLQGTPQSSAEAWEEELWRPPSP